MNPILALVTPLALGAGPFQIKDRTSDIKTSLPDVYNAFDQAANNIETTLNDSVLNESSRESMLSSVAKANSESLTGQTGDYSSNPSKIVVGLGAGGAYKGADTSKSGDNSLPSFGVSAQPLLLVGLSPGWLGIKNIGPIDASRMMWNAHFGYVTIPVSVIDVTPFNFGVGVTYQLVRPVGNFLIGWGGVGVGTGFHYANLAADFKTKFDISQESQVAGQTATVTWNSDVAIGASSTSMTIPLDIYSGFTLLAQTIMLGFGPELVFGSTRFTGKASGPVSAKFSSDLGSINLFSGTGELDLENDSARGKAGIAGFRFFGGYQVNLWVLRLFAQGGYKTDGTLFGSAGLRVSL